MSELNDNQEHPLNNRQQDLLKEAMERKAQAVRKAGTAFPAPVRKIVTPEEYSRRLRAQMGSDEFVANSLKQQRIDASLKEWDEKVGPRFARARIEDPRIKERVDTRVERIVKGGPLHKNSMVLTGHLGVGKTWTGFAYARRLIEEGMLRPSEVLFGTEIGLLTPLALASYDRAEEIQAFLSAQHKFYFIDEVGRATFKSTELRHEIWYAIINHAYENHIPVVLTTNKSSKVAEILDTKSNKKYKSEMEMWIGEAAYDRIKYMVGDDGTVIPSEENKRGEVNEQLDTEYSDGTPRSITLRLSTKESLASQELEKKVAKPPVEVEHEFPQAVAKKEPVLKQPPVRKKANSVASLRPPR